VAKFEILVRHQNAPGGSSGSSARASNPAAQAEKEAKKAAVAIKAAATLAEGYWNKVGAAQTRSAKKAADDQIREARRAEQQMLASARSQTRAAEKAANDSAKAHASAARAREKEEARAQKAAEKGLNAGVRYADKVAREREKSEKRAADAAIRERARAENAARKAAAEQERVAKRAADVADREARRAADTQAREAKRAADLQIREAERLLREIQRRNAAIGKRASGAATSIGYGAYRAAGQVANGARTAAAGIADGGIGGLLGSVPRAAGDMLKAGGEAAASLSRGFGVALGKLLPGALGFVGKAVGNAFAVVGELAGALGSAAGEIAGFVGDKLGTALKVALGGAVAVGIFGIKRALEGEDLREFFDGFARSSGVTAKEGIDKLRTSTKGMISDIDLLRAANQAWQTGAVETADQFAELAGLAVTLGKNIGERPVAAIDKFTLALATGNAKGLKPFVGASIDFKKAIKDTEVALGRTKGGLSEAQEVAIRYRVAIDAAKTATKGLASQTKNVSDEFDTAKAAIANSVEQIGIALLPGLSKVLKAIEPIATAIGKFFDNNNKEIADGIASAVGSIANGLSGLPALIENIKLSEVFELASTSAQSLWITFRTYGEAAIAAIGDLFEAMWVRSKALAIDTAEAGLKGDNQGLGVDSGREPRSRPENARSTELKSQAAGLTQRAGLRFGIAAESLANNPELAELRAIRAAILNSAGQRAATVPPPDVVQPSATPPQASIGTTGTGGITFNASGANSGTGSAASSSIFSTIVAISKQFNAALPHAIDATKAQKKITKAALEAEKDIVSDLRSREDIQREATKRLKEARDDEIRAREEIAESFNAAKETIVGNFKAAMDDIVARVGEAAGQLRSAAGGGSFGGGPFAGGPFAGADLDKAIPANVRRAARKQTRRATKALKREISQQAAGMGDEDLINGGADRIFKNIGAQQVLGNEGGANQAQQQLDAALNQLSDLRGQKEAALEALTEKTNAIADQIVENEFANIAALEAAQGKVEELSSSLETINERLKKMEKAFEQVPGRPGGRG
jgi:hypothetical protein